MASTPLKDVVDQSTGEILLGVNEEITEEKVEELREAKIKGFKILFIDGLNVGPYLRDTLIADKTATQDDAILEIYGRMRPGDPPHARDGTHLLEQPLLQPRTL